MFRVCPSHSTLRVAIEYRWTDGHFRSHPAAERIKNVDQAIVGFVGVVLGAVITAGIAAGANYWFCRKFCVWTMRPWNNDVDYAASE